MSTLSSPLMPIYLSNPYNIENIFLAGAFTFPDAIDSVPIVPSIDLPLVMQQKIASILQHEPLGFSYELAEAVVREIVKQVSKPVSNLVSSYFKVKKKTKSDATFWVRFVKENEVVIEINKPNVVIGKGTYKRVKLGVDLTVPTLETETFVRFRPKKQMEGWRPDPLHGFTIHERLHAAFCTSGLTGITEPPLARLVSTIESDDLEKVVEYRQKFYPLTLDKACKSKILDVKKTILFAIHLFETIQGLHANGVVHRDIKRGNVYVGEDHLSLLNDFDITTYEAIDAPAHYVYWDLCAQKGIITPNADIVGVCITVLIALFPNHGKEIEEDDYHLLIRNNSFKKLCKKLNVDKCPQAAAIRGVVKLFSGILKKEKVVYGFAFESAHKYFKEVSVDTWTFQQLRSYCADNTKETFNDILVRLNVDLEDEELDQVSEFICDPEGATDEDKEKPLLQAITFFKKNSSAQEYDGLFDIVEMGKLLKKLLLDNQITNKSAKKLGNAEFFKNLLSRDVEARVKAFTELETIGVNTRHIINQLNTILSEM